MPAYRSLLASHAVDPDRISTFTEFDAQVPLIDKTNYLQKYALEDLCRGGKLAICDIRLRIELRPHGDPEYFPIGVKHRYTRR